LVDEKHLKNGTTSFKIINLIILAFTNNVKVKVRISLLLAMEAHRVARG
jgi:hypothetical protein